MLALILPALRLRAIVAGYFAWRTPLLLKQLRDLLVLRTWCTPLLLIAEAAACPARSPHPYPHPQLHCNAVIHQARYAPLRLAEAAVGGWGAPCR